MNALLAKFHSTVKFVLVSMLIISYGMNSLPSYVNPPWHYTGAVSDAVSIMGEYLKDDPWLKRLCCKLRYLHLELSQLRKNVYDPLPEFVLVPFISLGY